MSETMRAGLRRVCDWLDGVRQAARRVEPLTREVSALEEARAEMLPWRAGGGADARGSSHPDPTASAAEARMGDLERLLGERRAELDGCLATVGEAGSALMRMASALGAQHADALELYYIDCADTWSDVAREMGVSDRVLYRLRVEAYGWIEETGDVGAQRLQRR